MLAFPPLSTALLPCTMSLPAAPLHPALLLLTRDCLPLGTLRLPLLPGLLSALSLLLLRPLLLSLLDLLLLRRLAFLSALFLGLPRLLPNALFLLLLLWLLGPLLLWLLSALFPPLLRLLLPLLPASFLLLLLLLLIPLLLRLLGGSLAPLLLRLPLLLLLLGRWRRTLLSPTLPCFRLALFFLLPIMLRVRRDNRPEKQKQGSGTGCSNELHGNHLR
jgi:hypothetical protein